MISSHGSAGCRVPFPSGAGQWQAAQKRFPVEGGTGRAPAQAGIGWGVQGDPRPRHLGALPAGLFAPIPSADEWGHRVMSRSYTDSISRLCGSSTDPDQYIPISERRHGDIQRPVGPRTPAPNHILNGGVRVRTAPGASDTSTFVSSWTPAGGRLRSR
jgi:hypothetical protein